MSPSDTLDSEKLGNLETVSGKSTDPQSLSKPLGPIGFRVHRFQILDRLGSAYADSRERPVDSGARPHH